MTREAAEGCQGRCGGGHGPGQAGRGRRQGRSGGGLKLQPRLPKSTRRQQEAGKEAAGPKAADKAANAAKSARGGGQASEAAQTTGQGGKRPRGRRKRPRRLPRKPLNLPPRTRPLPGARVKAEGGKGRRKPRDAEKRRRMRQTPPGTPERPAIWLQRRPGRLQMKPPRLRPPLQEAVESPSWPLRLW